MFSGLLLIDKPTGITSHDVCLAVRRRLPKGTKVGHSGTLDPMASGLLIILVGAATKSAAFYQKLSKTYSGSIRFGQETDTGDLDGTVVREGPVPALETPDIQLAMRGFEGKLEIPPPLYSAVKYKGRPLYSYARKGIPVPVQKSRTCHVYDWLLLSCDLPEIAFRLRCSHGTYARSLAVELGRKLGGAALLSKLRREKIGEFDVVAALTMDAFNDFARDDILKHLQPVPGSLICFTIEGEGILRESSSPLP